MNSNFSFALPFMAAVLIAGCGSDNNKPMPTPEPERPSNPYSNVFGTPRDNASQPQNLKVSIVSSIVGTYPGSVTSRYSCKQFGGPVDCNTSRTPGTWPNMTPPDDVFDNGDEVFEFDYLLSEVQLNMASDGFQKSMRPDIFNDGYASIADVLAFTAAKYNLEVEYRFDEELNTYWIESINGVRGMDPATLPSNEDLLVPFGECTGPGGWKALYGNRQHGHGGYKNELEEIYQRLDEFVVTRDSKITFVPMCQEERKLREDIYRKELARIASNGGEVVIPEVIINLEWDKKAVFRNVKVTPHNLRSDIFKPGVLTHIDLIMSLAEHSDAVDVGINYWPEVSQDFVIDSYHLAYMSVNGSDDDGRIFQFGHDADGSSGWNYHAGEYERVNDTAYGMLNTYKWAFCGIELSGMSEEVESMGLDNQSIRFTLPGSPCTGGDWRPGSGTWLTPMADELSPDGDIKKGPLHMGYTPYSWGVKSPYAPLGTYTDKNGHTKNRAYFPHMFGGNGLHVMPDVVPMSNPEYFEFHLNAFFGGSDKAMQEQVSTGKASVVNYAFEPIPPELVFTAKDISLAQKPLTESHFGWQIPNCSNCHQGGDNGGHISGEMKPFECAECHGSNGAPKGHGEQASCGWCHAANLKQHGNAYSDVDTTNKWNPMTDPFATLGRQTHAAEWWGLYTDFPEAASCMTCHPSNSDRFINK